MTQAHDPGEQTEAKPKDNDSKPLKSPLLGLTALLGGLANIVTVVAFVNVHRGLFIAVGFIFVGALLVYIRRTIDNSTGKRLGAALIVGSLLLVATVGGFAGVYCFRTGDQGCFRTGKQDPRGVSPPSQASGSPAVQPSGSPTPLPEVSGSPVVQPSGSPTSHPYGGWPTSHPYGGSPTSHPTGGPPTPHPPSPVPPPAFTFDEPVEDASVSDNFSLSGTTPDLGADSLWLTDYAYAGDGTDYPSTDQVYYRDDLMPAQVLSGHWSTTHGRVGSPDDPKGTIFTIFAVRASPSCSQVIHDKQPSRPPRDDVIIGTMLPSGCMIIGTLHVKKA